MASTPLNIEVAVLNDLNPNIERIRFLIKRWSCSTCYSDILSSWFGCWLASLYL